MTIGDNDIRELYGRAQQYEILFKNTAGKIASIVKAIAFDDSDARSIAVQMRPDQYAIAYIMHMGKLIAALHPPIEY
jgi:hypothetical protein